MTAATGTVVVSGEGLAARRATRNSRVRAVILFAFGILAFFLGTRSLDTKATFSFWIDQQGGDSAVLQTPVGVLWIVAGVASWFIAILQLGAARRSGGGRGSCCSCGRGSRRCSQMRRLPYPRSARHTAGT